VDAGWMQTLFKTSDMPPVSLSSSELRFTNIPCQVWFVPSFFIDPATFQQYSVLDGYFDVSRCPSLPEYL